MAVGVHVNGIVRRPDGPHVWVARRAADKLLDPSKLDHIVAGGVPAGFYTFETLVKEAAEEAAIPASLSRLAVPVATITYAMDRPEGLRRACWTATTWNCPRILPRAPPMARWRPSSSGQSHA